MVLTPKGELSELTKTSELVLEESADLMNKDEEHMTRIPLLSGNVTDAIESDNVDKTNGSGSPTAPPSNRTISTQMFDIFRNKCTLTKKYLDEKDISGFTAMHYVSMNSNLELLNQLLNAGGSHNIADNDGSPPLGWAVYAKDSFGCVERLLNLMDENDIEKYGTNILFRAIAARRCPKSLELLLSKIKFKGIREVDEDRKLGFTLLQKLVYHMADYVPVEQECLQTLLAVLDKDDINAICEVKNCEGKTALHISVQENAFNAFDILVANEHTDIFFVNQQKRTVLHMIADAGWSVHREENLSRLLESSKLSDKTVKTKFLDTQDRTEETALKIAIRRDSVPLSRAILLSYPEPPASWLDENMTKKIYEKVPEIMLPLIDSGIQFEKKNYEAGDEFFEADLGALIGFERNTEAVNKLEYPDFTNDWYGTSEIPELKTETDFLSKILDSKYVKPDEQAAMLSHPVVVLFIHEKWNKLKELFWISIIANVGLLGLYIYFVVDLFWLSCPYVQGEHEEGIKCSIEIWKTFLSYVVIFAQMLLFIIKLSVDFATTGFRNLINIENIVQLAFTIGVLLVGIFGVQSWCHCVASVTVLLASFLAFSQLLKIPSQGIYADIFYTVLQKIIWLMAIFSPLLIGFTVAISLVLPGNPQYPFLPLNFIKILVMMTGEINYDEVFHGEYESPFRLYAILLFALFTIIVSIVIFNLLLGFTINDIQGIQKEREVHILTSTLGQVVVFERLVFSKLIQKILPKKFLRRYLVVTHVRSQSGKEFSKKLEDISADLRKKIMGLAREYKKKPKPAAELKK